MAFVYTRPARAVFAPVSASGDKRGASMGESQVWGVEVERAIASLEQRIGPVSFNPLADWIELHSA